MLTFHDSLFQISECEQRVQQAKAGFGAAQPFIKWVGGKRKLISRILEYAPNKFERYIEPFLGGGAVALSLGLEPCT